MCIWKCNTMIMMNLRKQGFLILFSLLALGCAETSDIAQPKTNIEIITELKVNHEMDEYSIYSIVNDEMYVSPSVGSVLIDSRTRTYALPYKTLEEALANLNKNLSNRIEDEILRDFLDKNKTTKILERRFNIRVPYSLLSKKYLESVFIKGNSWNEFLKQHPGKSIIAFSKVGLNVKKDKALVYTSTNSGGKSGFGYYVLLVKENNNWKIAQKIEAWVS